MLHQHDQGNNLKRDPSEGRSKQPAERRSMAVGGMLLGAIMAVAVLLIRQLFVDPSGMLWLMLIVFGLGILFYAWAKGNG